MIRHIVSWTLTAEDPSEKLAVAQEIKERLEGLAAVIPGIARAHVGIDLGETAGNWDVVLDSDFASREDLDAYQVHPAHTEVSAWIGSVRSQRASVDYEL